MGTDDLTGGAGAGDWGSDGPPAYLVVLRHAVVAEDMGQALAEADPDARVIVATALPEAERALEGVGRVAVAFVGAGPRGFRASALSEGLARRGGRVVLMGGEAEAEGEAAGFEVLSRPFTMAAVTAFLDGPPDLDGLTGPGPA